MDLTGEYRIPASRQTVWDALNDPEVLKACIPGCKSLEMGEDNEMTATVVSKIGPVKATFKGTVRLENLNPPESYSIAGEGKGGVAGFAKGGADVKLAEDGDETVLTYEAKAQVGGKLAQLGSRLIDSTAKKMADDFFGAFSAKVGGGDEAAAATDEAAAEAPAEAAADAAAVEAPAAAAASDETVAAEKPAEPAEPRQAFLEAARTAATESVAEVTASTPKPAASKPEPSGSGLSFSGPMFWVAIGAAALILILAIAQ